METDTTPVCYGETAPSVSMDYEMLMWMHNTYLDMMHRRCALETEKARNRGKKQGKKMTREMKLQ